MIALFLDQITFSIILPIINITTLLSNKSKKRVTYIYWIKIKTALATATILMTTIIVNLVTTITATIEVALVAYQVTTLFSIHLYNIITRMKQAKTRLLPRPHLIILIITMADSITTRYPTHLWLTLGLLLIPNQQPLLLLQLIPLITAQTCLILFLLLQELVVQALLRLRLGCLQKHLLLLCSNKKIRKILLARRESPRFPLSQQAQSREDHLYYLLPHLAFVQQEELKLSILPKIKTFYYPIIIIYTQLYIIHTQANTHTHTQLKCMHNSSFFKIAF